MCRFLSPCVRTTNSFDHFRVRFVQLTSFYWEYVGPIRPGWQNLPYRIPEGCTVSNLTSVCPPGVLDTSLNVTLCQVCDLTKGHGGPWSYYEWIFTMRPGIFGLIPGIANITGIALIGILTVMVVCSMPFVRRGGYFEVFYFTHLLYGAVHVLILLTNRVSHHGF